MFNLLHDRKIPSLMATQHPDNACAPFWSDTPFINTHLEVEEIYQSFFGLGCDEYMWDWEGKFADEGMIERLLTNHFEAFKQEQLGRDRFITLRIPNIWEEKTFKLARAYMSVLSAAEFMKSLNLYTPPVFELILPMTKSADQLLHIQKTFQKTAQLHEQIFCEEDSSACNRFGEDYIHIIPLFESVDDLANCAEVLTEFLRLHREHFKKDPPYLRVFIARSDPALNAGFVPAVLASRLALREIARMEKETGIPMYPIIGSGSLPFRGGINPENLEKVLPQYEGVQTVSIQSAFRYDYPQEEVKTALQYIQKTLPSLKAPDFDDATFEKLKTLMHLFKDVYHPTLEAFAPTINAMAKHVPARRERVQHVGLFGYNRGVGEVKLPRAISFTAACYSLGVPPEFIGTGRALKKAKAQNLLDLLEQHFFTLRSELHHAGKYLNIENLEHYAKSESWAKEILEDVHLCQEILGIELGPQKPNHFLHRNLTSSILYKQELGLDFQEDLVEAAVMRKSLG
ncbi:phosphoenolpyruvate carboxylase [Candidatus Peregrinibacteria bacterium]|nr:MAG: phosphoenolpyruvate carboxylase [Candidatus Peregrinibacteria bacterium]